MENKTIHESLQEYLKNTPKEKVLKDWNEFQHLDNEGITVKEFLENNWQQEQIYTEEDLLNFGAFVRIEDKKEKRLFLIQDYYKKWLEKYKKK